MSFEEAIRQRVSQRVVYSELRGHGFSRHQFKSGDDGEIICCDDDTIVSHRGRDGLYSGRSVLEWLGY